MTDAVNYLSEIELEKVVILEPVEGIIMDVSGTVIRSDYIHEIGLPFFSANAPRLIQMWQLKKTGPLEDISFIAEQAKSKAPSEIAQHTYDTMRRLHQEAPYRNVFWSVVSEGLADESIRVELFADVPGALEKWSQQNTLALATFSNIPQAAQKSIFSKGYYLDTSCYIYRHFDTQTHGPKTSVESFEKMCSELTSKPSAIAYLASNPFELLAAERAGFIPIEVARENKKRLCRYHIESFDQLVFNSP